VGDAQPVHGAQRRPRGTEIREIVIWTRNLQRAAGNVAAHQAVAVGIEQRRRDAERRHRGEGAPLAVEKMDGERPRPPRHFVEAPQHGGKLAGVVTEGAALHR